MLGTMEHKFSIFDENVPSVIENENAKKEKKKKRHFQISEINNKIRSRLNI
jgi:hypothetical protein